MEKIKKTALELLNEDLIKTNNKKLSQQINSYIHKFHIRMNSLNALNKEQRSYFMNLLYKDTRKNIQYNINQKYKSLLLNVIASKYREVLKKI